MKLDIIDCEIDVTVVDVDSQKEIFNILEVNTKTGIVTVWDKNRKNTPTGRIPVKRLHYTSIYTITGGKEHKITLIHCYRLNKIHKHRSGQFGINNLIGRLK